MSTPKRATRQIAEQCCASIYYEDNVKAVEAALCEAVAMARQEERQALRVWVSTGPSTEPGGWRDAVIAWLDARSHGEELKLSVSTAPQVVIEVDEDGVVREVPMEKPKP